MKKKGLFGIMIIVNILLGGQYGYGQKVQPAGFAFTSYPEKQQIDIAYQGQLLTAYCYYDSVMKPILFPINTLSGITVTRGYPLHPRTGERVDHPHQVGMWFTYESVNGVDFWNTSTAIPYNRRAHYGTIVHDRVVTSKAHGNQATLEVSAQWKDHSGQPLLVEFTTYTFAVADSNVIIDRTTTLRAIKDVTFHDIKDGLLGMRVARELELPYTDSIAYLAENGKEKRGKASDYPGVSGQYLNSEGLIGDAVWGKRARWVTLHGVKEGKHIAITIMDHPKNVGSPGYWHARGYGLFAINPLGQAVFSNGQESMRLTLKPAEAVTFRYRVVIHEGTPLSAHEMDEMATTFGRSR